MRTSKTLIGLGGLPGGRLESLLGEIAIFLVKLCKGSIQILWMLNIVVRQILGIHNTEFKGNNDIYTEVQLN